MAAAENMAIPERPSSSDEAVAPAQPAAESTTAPQDPTDGEPPTDSDDITPTNAPADQDPTVSRSGMKTMAAAALGIILSTLLAAVVTAYFDVWTSSRSPVPASSGIHAEAEVWWDLTRDVKGVRMASPVDIEDLQQEYPDADAALDGLVENGGSYAGMMRIRLTLMNFTKVPVSITGVRARTIDEKPASEGALLSCGGPQGGIDITRVRIDLASPNKVAQEYDGDDIVGQYPTQVLQLAKQDEPAIFDVRVEDGEATYSYVIDIEYTQGTQEGRIVVDDSGKPFVLAPAEKDTQVAYRCDSAMTGWAKIR